MPNSSVLFPSNLNKSVPPTGNAWAITVGGNVVWAGNSEEQLIAVLHRALIKAATQNDGGVTTGVFSIHYGKNGALLPSPTVTSTGGRFA